MRLLLKKGLSYINTVILVTPTEILLMKKRMKQKKHTTAQETFTRLLGHFFFVVSPIFPSSSL